MFRQYWAKNIRSVSGSLFRRKLSFSHPAVSGALQTSFVAKRSLHTQSAGTFGTSTRQFFSTATSKLAPPHRSQQLFTNLFTYIKQNKTLPNELTQYSLADEGVQSLLRAIAAGDDQDDIFTDPDCYLYLLYLISIEKIDFWQGMTVYNYLHCLMQFTDKLLLKSEDMDVNLSDEKFRKFAVEKLVEKGVITALGNDVLITIIERCAQMGYTIKLADLQNVTLQLPPSEHWLFRADIQEVQVGINDYDAVMQRLVQSIPVIHFQYTPVLTYFWLPSFSLVRFVLQQMSSAPMLMQPIFGAVKQKTLVKLHLDDIHPVALYATCVKSNPKAVHGLRVGPVSQMWHDIFHTFSATMFLKRERQFIYNDFIPALEISHLVGENPGEVDLTLRLAAIAEFANDFDLSHKTNYLNPQTRLVNYLARALHPHGEDTQAYPSAHLQQHFGSIEDKIFYLLHVALRQAPPEKQQIWQDIIARAHGNRSATFFSEPAYRAIKTLACPQPFNRKASTPVSWYAWQDLLATTTTSKELWRKATVERQDELLVLITDYRLAFFPPFLKLEGEKKREFQEFVAERMVVNNRLAFNR